MNDPARQADLLDQFLHDLIDDPEAAAPPELDEETAAMARAVVRAERVAPPRRDTQERVWQRTLADVEAHRSARSRRLRWLRLGRAGRAVGLAAVATLALVLIGVLVWLGRPRTGAADVVVRAEQAANDPTVFRLRTYQGVMTGRSRPSATTPFFEWRQQVWYQAPAMRRFELDTPPPAVPSGPPSGPGTASPPRPTPSAGLGNPRGAVAIYLTDGTSAWQYQADSGLVEQIDPYSVGGPPFGTPDPQVIFRSRNSDFDDTLAGTETVAGRSTYVVDLLPKRAAQVRSLVARTRVRIDRQTYLPLRFEAWDAQGNLLISWAFTTLQLNPTLDVGIFTFSPPPAIQILDARGRATPSPLPFP